MKYNVYPEYSKNKDKCLKLLILRTNFKSRVYNILYLKILYEMLDKTIS